MLAIVQLGIGATYAFTPPVRALTRISIVGYIEALGPIWIIAFFLTGACLLYARLSKRYLVEAHAFCFGVSVFYAGALWGGVIYGVPFAFSIAAWTSSAVAAAHYAMSRWYAAEGAR